jgi:MFS family permease
VSSSIALAVPPGARAERAAPRLLTRDFVLLWQAQLVSQFGNQAFTIAMMAWTADVTRSATMSGLMLMAGVLPIVLLGPLTGAFADGPRSRLRIIRTCDLVSGAFVSMLAVGFLAGPSAWRPAMLFGAALLVGVCNAFFDPAVNAFVPDLVPREQIEAANAFRQSSKQVTVLAAQSVGGILYALLGPAMLFLIDGLSFLFAGASEALIGTQQSICAQQSPISTLSVSAGLRYVASQPGMVGFLLITAVFNALLMPVSVLLPVYATTCLQADVRWYGFLLAAISAGAVAGCTVAGAGGSSVPGWARRALVVAGFGTLAILLAVLGQTRSRWIALAILFGTGVCSGMVNVFVVSVIQRRTSGEFRGRVLGLHAMVIRLLVPIGLVGGGAVADLTGRNVPLVYGICGMLALSSVIFLAAHRPTRAFVAST